jgi:hypothetical protein
MQRKIIFIKAILIITSLSILGQMTDKQSGKISKSEQNVMVIASEYADAALKKDTIAMV